MAGPVHEVARRAPARRAMPRIRVGRFAAGSRRAIRGITGYDKNVGPVPEKEDQAARQKSFAATARGVSIEVAMDRAYCSEDYPDGFRWVQTVTTNDPSWTAVGAPLKSPPVTYVDPKPNDATTPLPPPRTRPSAANPAPRRRRRPRRPAPPPTPSSGTRCCWSAPGRGQRDHEARRRAAPTDPAGVGDAERRGGEGASCARRWRARSTRHSRAAPPPPSCGADLPGLLPGDRDRHPRRAELPRPARRPSASTPSGQVDDRCGTDAGIARAQCHGRRPRAHQAVGWNLLKSEGRTDVSSAVIGPPARTLPGPAESGGAPRCDNRLRM